MLLTLIAIALLLPTTIQVQALDEVTFDKTIRDQTSVAIDSQHNSYIVWREYTNPQNKNIVMQRISSSGFRDWSIEKTLISRANVAEYVTLVSNEQDELFLTWAEVKESTIYEFYIQKFDTSANPLWSQPYLFFTLENENVILNDVAQPQVDNAGNIYLSYVVRGEGKNQVIYQKLDTQLNKKWPEGVIIDEIDKTKSTDELFYSDLNLDKTTGAVYLAYLALRNATPNSIQYHLMKIDVDGKIVWKQTTAIPLTPLIQPVIIHGPVLNRFSTLNLAWTIENSTTKEITQYLKRINTQGIIQNEPSLTVKHLYNMESGVTSLQPYDDNAAVYLISDQNKITAYRYNLPRGLQDQKLSETSRLVLFPEENIFPHVSTWSAVSDDRDNIYFAWSQYSTNDRGEAGNYQIIAQQLNNDLSTMWGSGEKANSKKTRNPAETPIMKPKEEIPSVPTTRMPRKIRTVELDLDGDGLSNDAETRIYFTDVSNADTDADGYLDGEEIMNGYNPKGICRIKQFSTRGNYAYDRGRLLQRDDETCRSNHLKREIFRSVSLSQYKKITPQRWMSLDEAFIYGDYPVSAIVRAIETGGHTVHQNIRWDAWRETEEYQQYIVQ